MNWKIQYICLKRAATLPNWKNASWNSEPKLSALRRFFERPQEYSMTISRDLISKEQLIPDLSKKGLLIHLEKQKEIRDLPFVKAENNRFTSSTFSSAFLKPRILSINSRTLFSITGCKFRTLDIEKNRFKTALLALCCSCPIIEITDPGMPNAFTDHSHLSRFSPLALDAYTVS